MVPRAARARGGPGIADWACGREGSNLLLGHNLSDESRMSSGFGISRTSILFKRSVRYASGLFELVRSIPPSVEMRMYLRYVGHSCLRIEMASVEIRRCGMATSAWPCGLRENMLTQT